MEITESYLEEDLGALVHLATIGIFVDIFCICLPSFAQKSESGPKVRYVSTFSGPGLQWYNRSGHELQLPVVEVIATGERFVVSEAQRPEILDLECTATAQHESKQQIMTWSRISGDVMLPSGDVAFNLQPESGLISGTPNIRFEIGAQGRGELQIACKVALGGRS